jgi:hypothetical protein
LVPDQNSTDVGYVTYDLQIIVEALEKLNYSKCGQDAMVVMEGIAKRERWALQSNYYQFNYTCLKIRK